MGDLSIVLDENIEKIQKLFGHSSDLCLRRLELREGRQAAVLFIATIIDPALVDEFVVQELLRERMSMDDLTLTKDVNLAVHIQQRIETSQHAANMLLQGFSVVFLDGRDTAIAAGTGGGERRSVSEPSSESVVRGPRESFNESLLTNIGLVRKRVATPKLRVVRMRIGKLSNTSVAMIYIDGIAKGEVVEEVKKRIHRIDLAGVLESQYIEEMLEDEDNGYTPFPTIFNTERPDRVAGGLLEGRVAILVEGTPVALVVPSTLSLFLHSNEDYYQRYDIASLLRLLRTFTFILSIVLPGFYVALLTFHQEMIPSPLLIALTGQREGVPFNIAIEVFLMEITFEILREAGIRLPKTIGSAVSIVGGLVLGQAAVEAGLVAPGTVIAVSATAIASFCTPTFSLAIAARMIRFAFICFCAILGAFGLFFGLILVLIHLNSLRSIGVPYLSPISPVHFTNWSDLFIRLPLKYIKEKPVEIAETQEQGKYDKRSTQQ